MRRAPVVEVTVSDADGKPINHGGVGWLVEDAASIQAYYSHFFGGDGKPWSDPEGVPEGQVTLFTTTDGQTPSFATATITTKAGGHYSVTLKPDKPQFRIRGKAVAADDSPLAAVVSIEPISPKALSAVDRVLLEFRGQDTDSEGNFEFRITSPAQVVVRLSTWVGLGAPAEHVRTARLAEAKVESRSAPELLVLKAPPAAVVRCIMIGPAKDRLSMVELGLSFVPHDLGYGHSGSCVWAGGKASADQDPNRKYPEQINFIWPRGVETLLVTGRSTEVALSTTKSESFAGGLVLRHATDSCQIPGYKPRDP